MKTIRKSFTIYEENQKMLDELVYEESASGESEIIRRALVEFYRGRKIPGKKRNAAPRTPAPMLVERLYKAEVIASPAGDMVRFPTFVMPIPGTIEQGEMTLPLEQLTEALVKRQFDGDKDVIIQLLEEHARTEI